MKDDELIASAPQKTTENLQVLSETYTVEVTEPYVMPTTSSDVDDITSLQQKIDYLLSDNFLSEWMQSLSSSLFKLEGTATEDFYEPGFSDPNAMLCPEMGSTLQVFIFVTSAPDHRKERQSIRETWGTIGNRSDVALGFVVGATHNRTLEYKLQRESLAKGDLIRTNSIDSYKNLTLKSLSMLEWTLTYCPMTQFVLKTDDDMFLNMRLLLNFHGNTSERY
uniref:Hexosyltransferase n=1 Tax=Phlebotomus papatasi TaxID=29031 RepID=A0A1B0D0R2_PHLPP